MQRYFDVIKYLEDRGIEYDTTGKNVTKGWIEISSPFVFDKSRHLGINLTTKIFNCWLSGEKGGMIKLIHALESCSWGQAKAIFEQFLDYTLVPPEDLSAYRRQQAGSRITPKNFRFVTDECPASLERYLANRNYSLEFAARYDCMWADPFHSDKKWRFRLMMPVYQDYEIKTFVGRAIGANVDLRYKNFPEEESILPAKNCVYGIDDVKENSDILVVEGIFDKWRLDLNEIPNVVSTLGTAVTDEQVYLLKGKRPKKIWVMFDKNAEEQAYKLIRGIPFCDTELLMLDGLKDPDLFGIDDIAELKEILECTA